MISIRSVRMKNFRRYEDVTVRLVGGITGIVGDNGSGKSTIMDAIGYAFYGAVPSIVRTTKNDMKRMDAPDIEGWGVEVEFEVDSEPYRIVRMNPGATAKSRGTAVMFHDRDLVAKDDTAIKERVKELFGMDYQAFSVSVFCRQSEVSALSTMTATERKKLVLRMLGIESIEDVVKAVRRDKRDKSNQVDGMKEAMQDMTGKDMMPLYKDKKFKAERTISDSQEQLEQLSDRMQLLEEGLGTVVDERNALLGSRKDLDTRRTELEDVRVGSQRRVVLEQDISSMEKKLDELKDTLEECDEAALATLSGMRSQRDEIKQKIHLISHDIQGKEKEISRIEGLSGKCPTCDQDITQKHRDSMIGDIRNDIESMQANVTDMEQEIEAMRSILDVAEEQERISNRNKTKQRDIDSLSRSIEDKRTGLQSLGGFDEDMERELTDVKSRLSELDTRLGEMNRRHDELLEERKNMVNQRSELEKEIARAQTSLDQVSASIRDYKERAQRIKEFEENAESLAVLEANITKFKDELIGRVRPMISMVSSQLIEAMSEGRYKRLEIGDDYSIQLYDHGVPYGIDRYSGGEKDMINLAIRLALSQIIAEQSGAGAVGFIILDEVFGSADDNRRETIMVTLESLLSRYGQIICITHIEDIKGMLPEVLTVAQDGARSVLIREKGGTQEDDAE